MDPTVLLHMDPTAYDGLSREARLKGFERYRDKLAPAHREVVLLAYVDRLPVARIARRLNRSPAAVTLLLERAVDTLRQLPGDAGEGPPLAPPTSPPE